MEWMATKGIDAIEAGFKNILSDDITKEVLHEEVRKISVKFHDKIENFVSRLFGINKEENFAVDIKDHVLCFLFGATTSIGQLATIDKYIIYRLHIEERMIILGSEQLREAEKKIEAAFGKFIPVEVDLIQVLESDPKKVLDYDKKKISQYLSHEIPENLVSPQYGLMRLISASAAAREAVREQVKKIVLTFDPNQNQNVIFDPNIFWAGKSSDSRFRCVIAGGVLTLVHGPNYQLLADGKRLYLHLKRVLDIPIESSQEKVKVLASRVDEIIGKQVPVDFDLEKISSTTDLSQEAKRKLETWLIEIGGVSLLNPDLGLPALSDSTKEDLKAKVNKIFITFHLSPKETVLKLENDTLRIDYGTNALSSDKEKKIAPRITSALNSK